MWCSHFDESECDQLGHATTNGLSLQRKLIAQSRSPVVSNIRAAGGVIVGRSNAPAIFIVMVHQKRFAWSTLNPWDQSITLGDLLVLLHQLL